MCVILYACEAEIAIALIGIWKTVRFLSDIVEWMSCACHIRMEYIFVFPFFSDMSRLLAMGLCQPQSEN